MHYETAAQKLRVALLQKKFAFNTCAKYEQAFAAICKFCNIYDDVTKLCDKDIQLFLEYAKLEKEKSESTVCNYYGAFKFIFSEVLDKQLYPTSKKLDYLPQVFTPIIGELGIEAGLIRYMQELKLADISQSSQRTYLRYVEKFIKATGKTDDLTMLTLYDVKNFLYFAKQNMAIGTCNAYITAIKHFFVLVLQLEWNNDFIRRGKLPKKLPIILSKETVKKLINSIENPVHRMIAILMYSSGLRVSEAVSLRVADINSTTMQIFINQGKGRKDRFAILSLNCLAELRKYWKQYRPVDYLFPSIKVSGCYISVRTIETAITMAAKNIGIKEHVTPHTLRHCFATHLIENSTDVFETKDALGHASLRSTAVYVHLANTNGYNIASPYDL